MKKSILLFGFIFVFQSLFSANENDQIRQYLTALPSKKGAEKVQLLIKLSEAYRTVSFHECIKYGMEAIRLAETMEDLSLAGSACQAMGSNYMKSSDPKSALPFLNQGFIYYKETKEKRGMANCLNKIGISYSDLSDYPKAEDYLNQALTITREHGYKKLTAKILANLGAIKVYQKQFGDALNFYLQMRKIGEEIGDSSIIGASYITLAFLYDNDEGNPQKALAYLEKARGIFNRLGNKNQEARILNNMATTYANSLNEFKKALTLYEQSLRLKRELDDKQGVALLENNIGLLYAQTGNHTKAVELVTRSLHTYEQISDKAGVAMVYFNLGDIYLDLEKFNDAVRYYKESYELSKKIGYNDYLYESCKRIFQCYAGLGNYKEFNHYFDIYDEYITNTITHLKKEQAALVEENLQKTGTRDNGLMDNNKPPKDLSKQFVSTNFVITIIVFFLVVLSFFLYYDRIASQKNTKP
ncbi:MAG: tetratricopeptide repeat protein [Bacteroidales bacterium]|nr:tetratricopeptide repeat protein [Bacteroidales bacterium]